MDEFKPLPSVALIMPLWKTGAVNKSPAPCSGAGAVAGRAGYVIVIDTEAEPLIVPVIIPLVVGRPVPVMPMEL